MCCKTQILAVAPTIAGNQMSRRPQDLAFRSSDSRCSQHIPGLLCGILFYLNSACERTIGLGLQTLFFYKEKDYG
jgi:hypothetical protein